MEKGGSLLFAHETRGSDMLFVQCSYHIHIPYSTHSCITGCFRHLKTDGRLLVKCCCVVETAICQHEDVGEICCCGTGPARVLEERG